MSQADIASMKFGTNHVFEAISEVNPDTAFEHTHTHTSKQTPKYQNEVNPLHHELL